MTRPLLRILAAGSLAVASLVFMAGSAAAGIS